MDDVELLQYCRDDAMKWAEKFCELISAGRAIDVDLMVAWFANAIEHSHALRTGTLPTVLPDGSAFFVA